MRMPVSLSSRESVSFLKVVYSFFIRDGKLSAIEEEVLSMLVAAFKIKGDQQKEFQVMFFTNVESMAEEVNKIGDPKARLYLLAIIHELHLIEKEKQPSRWFSKSGEDKFETAYNSLLGILQVNISEVEELTSIVNPSNYKSTGSEGRILGEISAGIGSLKGILRPGRK